MDKCPRYNLKQILEEREYQDYSDDIKYVIDLITIGKEIDPVGSSKYYINKYPSDLDLFEVVKGCCHVNSVRLRLVQRIQLIIKNIKQNDNVIFKRFQCGYDKRYDLYLGKEENGHVVDFDVTVTKHQLTNLYNQGLITQTEYNRLYKLLLPNITLDNYLTLYYFFNKKMIVDWTEKEIVQGNKKLRGNKTIYLYEALTDMSLVKLDVVAYLPYTDLKNKSRFLEVTNWFLIQIADTEGNVKTFSIVQEDRIKTLKMDILRYSSEYHFDPLKAAKRLWNYLLEIKPTDYNVGVLKRLAPLFSSYMAFLNSILADLKVQSRLLRNKFITKTYYHQFLNDLKIRMERYAPQCYFDFDINQSILKTLDENEIQQNINLLTIKYLTDNHLDIKKLIDIL